MIRRDARALGIRANIHLRRGAQATANAAAQVNAYTKGASIFQQRKIASAVNAASATAR